MDNNERFIDFLADSMTGLQSTSSRISAQLKRISLPAWLVGAEIDSAQDHRVRLLRAVLVMLAITMFLYLGILASHSYFRPALPFLLIELSTLMGLDRLNQRGATRLAARLLVGIVAGGLFAIPLLTGTGLSMIVVYGYFALILLTGLLLDWKASLVALILALLSSAGLAWLEQTGLLLNPSQDLTPFESWVFVAPLLVLSVGIMLAAGNAFRSILRQTQANSEALAEANRRYEAQAAELADYQEELALLLEDRTTTLDEVTAQALIFMALADNSPIGIAITDLEQRVTYANDAFHAIFGYDPRSQEVVGLSVATFWPEGADDQRAAIDRQVIEGGWTGDILMRRKDGTLFDVGGSAFNVNDATGRVCGQALLARDITYRKQAEHDLRRALEHEQQLSELRSRFVSMVSHEFRTPLSVIQSSADTLERYNDRLDAVRRAQRFERIHTQVKHMTVMLDEIMTIGKLESRMIEFNPIPVDVVKLCQELVDEMRLLGDAHPIELSVTSEDCPPLDLDEKLMRQIVTNLLSNALKYSPGGQPVQVWLDYRDPRTLILSVADQGIGIPLEDQPSLFEAFHRASNVGTITGTGLGLAIVRRAVELHDGTIDFTSGEGQGTTFTLTFPRNR
jgi:PAS domain S-box-containing protein